MATCTVNLTLQSFTPDDDPPHMVATFTGSVGAVLAGTTASTAYDGVGAHAGAQCFVFPSFEGMWDTGMVFNSTQAHLNLSSSKSHGIARLQIDVQQFDDPSGAVVPTVNSVTPGVLMVGYNAVTYSIGTPEASSITFNSATVDVDYTLTVTSCTPSSGATAGGDAVTLGGTNFLPGAVVTFEGVPATGVVVNSATSISCVTPAGTGVVDVVVTNSILFGSASGTLTDGFTYLAAPVQLTITPASGAVAGGTPFTVTGTGFQPGLVIAFSGVFSDDGAYVSPTEITGTTPAHAAGVTAVEVTNPDLQVCVTPLTFTFGSTGPNIDSSPPWQTAGQWSLHRFDLIPRTEGDA